MSQAGVISSTGGGGGGTDPAAVHQIVTQSGTATAAANIINYTADDSTQNNTNGITSTGSGSTFNTILTNRIQGTVTTVGNTTQTVASFTLPAAGSYKFKFELSGYNASTPAAVGYSIDASARSTGAAATIVETPDADEDEDLVLQAEADWDVVASGNSVQVQVIGATGLTINWGVVGYYVYVA
jgi:hypothetical protein